MKNTSSILLSVTIFVAIIVVAAHASVQCSYVSKHAKPCLEYATGVASDVAPLCCKGLKRLVRNATSAGDKKDVCECFGKAFKHFKLVQNQYLDNIVSFCKVNVPFKLSNKPDCNK
ncbi:Non-specific lipid-transfer protein 3 [Linum grandiflorum]